MTSPSDPVPGARERGPMSNLGGQLRRVRNAAGLSAREVARQLEVSPSFISQIETGRSQPSVATLYSLAQLLDISIDELFETREETRDRGEDRDAAVSARTLAPDGYGHGSNAGPPPFGISVVRSGDRATLRLRSGVQWQRLAATSEHELSFMEVVYPVGSASAADGSMLRHAGYEYHYLSSGTLQVTVGVDEYVLHRGDSMGFDSSLPHLLRNPGEVDTHCIVTTHRCGAAQPQ
jgi:transcriptional regulator with XRE-family HTH domain